MTPKERAEAMITAYGQAEFQRGVRAAVKVIKRDFIGDGDDSDSDCLFGAAIDQILKLLPTTAEEKK